MLNKRKLETRYSFQIKQTLRQKTSSGVEWSLRSIYKLPERCFQHSFKHIKQKLVRYLEFPGEMDEFSIGVDYLDEKNFNCR